MYVRWDERKIYTASTERQGTTFKGDEIMTDKWKTREWSPTTAIYMALAEEFGEDNDEDAIQAFTEILVKKEVRVSLTRDLLEKCLTYCRLWADDEEGATREAIAEGELPEGFILEARRAVIELERLNGNWVRE